jgi:hypothetical protein
MSEDTPIEKEGLAKEPITWQDYEYLHFEKGSEWYWALGLIAVSSAIASLAFHNLLFAIFILISAFVLAIFASRKPEIVTFSVTQRGVYVDDKFHPYKALKSFGIDVLSPRHVPQLIIESKNKFSAHLIIPLEHIDPNEVHHFLNNFLPEENHKEPLIHKVMEYFGF